MKNNKKKERIDSLLGAKKEAKKEGKKRGRGFSPLSLSLSLSLFFVCSLFSKKTKKKKGKRRRHNYYYYYYTTTYADYYTQKKKKNGLKLPRATLLVLRFAYACGRRATTTGDRVVVVVVVVTPHHKKNLERPYGSSENSSGVSSAMSATVFPVIPAKVKPTCWWPKAYTTFVFAALLPMTGR